MGGKNDTPSASLTLGTSLKEGGKRLAQVREKIARKIFMKIF